MLKKNPRKKLIIVHVFKIITVMYTLLYYTVLYYYYILNFNLNYIRHITYSNKCK